MKRFHWALVLIGSPLALVGVLRDDRRLVWGAIVVLGLAFGLRLLERRAARPQ